MNRTEIPPYDHNVERQYNTVQQLTGFKFWLHHSLAVAPARCFIFQGCQQVTHMVTTRGKTLFVHHTLGE